MSVGNQVIAISTVAGGGTTNLQSTSAGIASGDVAIVEGYSNPGDGGGGTFYFQASPANRAITGVNTSQVTISTTRRYQNVNANDLRVLITTKTNHGLQAGQAVTISGCSDAGANGNFIIGIPPSGPPHNFNQATQFFLLGSVSTSNGTGGTISSTKVTITGHPYNPGQRVAIRAVKWTGGPGINGVFDLIGRIEANTISLPFFTAGSYVSGGMTGDDALHVPAADGSGVWHRIMPNAEVHLEWFNAPLDGTNDDAPAVFAAIQSGSNLSQTAGAFKVILPSTKPGVKAPHFATTVRVCRSVIIEGQGRDSTYIYTDAGMTTFIDEEVETSPTGEDAEFPVYREFSIYSSVLSGITGYVTGHPYVAGNMVYMQMASFVDGSSLPAGVPAPTYDLRYYYVCERGGTSSSTINDTTFAMAQNPQYTSDENLMGNPGGPLWRCHVHCGIFSKRISLIEKVAVYETTNFAFLYQGDGSAQPPAGPSANDGCVNRDFFALLCGGGIAVGPGVDTNSAVFGPGLITDAGYNQFNAHIQPGSGGIYNHAFGGCDYYDIIIQNPDNVGFLSNGLGGLSTFYGCHDESTYKNHFYGQCMVVGGQYTSGFTSNSSAFGGVLSGPWNNIVFGNSAAFLPGVTTSMTAFPAAPDVHLYYLSSSDDPSAALTLNYGHPALGGAGWWMHHYQEGVSGLHHWAISNRLATYDGTNLLGSVVWLGWGVGRGQSGSIGQKWPDFIEFDDAVSRDSMFIRSGKRLVGDRVRLAANPALGGPAEQIVVASGYEGPVWLKNQRYNAPNFDPLNSKGFTQCVRPNPANSSNSALQLIQRFQVQSVSGTGTSGSTEPVWPTTIAATVTDNPGANQIVWVNVGTAPTYGVVNPHIEDLTTIALPNGSSYTPTAIQAMGTRLRFAGALAANYSVMLQTPAQLGASPGSNSAQWLVQNNTSGMFTLTFKATATDPGVIVPQGQSRILWSNGVTMVAADPISLLTAPVTAAPGFMLSFGRTRVTMASDANITLSSGQYNTQILEMVSSVSLISTRNVVLPLSDGASLIVYNETMGSKSLQFIGSSGSGVTVGNGKRAIVYCDGTNWNQVTADK